MPSDIYNLQLCFLLISKDLSVIQGETEMKIVMIHGQNHQGSSCHIGRWSDEGVPTA